MVRGNGSARAETSVKATARPHTIRITMRRGPLRDTLDDDLSTITIPPICHSIALALERSFSFGSGCAAQQGHNLGREQTSRSRVLPGQRVTTESQPRRGLV